MEKSLEEIILAQWLQGECLDDIDLFSADDFGCFRKMFIEIKTSGIDDPIGLCRKSGVPVSALNEIAMAYNPTVYDNAVNTVFSDKGKQWLRLNLDKSLEEIRETLSKYICRNVSIPQPANDPVGDLLAELDRRAKEKPILFGLSDLDYYLCGIRPPDLTFIAARPSVGKSSFAFQGAVNVARQGKKVLFLALEMSETSVVMRHLLSKVNLTNHQIRSGIPREVWQNNSNELTDAFDELNSFYKGGDFLLYDRAKKGKADPADLKVIRELIRIHRPYLVVVDQLEQLKESGMKFIDKRSRFSHATHALQEIALQENVAIWCCCQVNRGADNTAPTLANLKESGTIEEDATNVIMLHREGEKTDTKQLITCDIAKQKDGQCGVINLIFDAPRFKFCCIE